MSSVPTANETIPLSIQNLTVAGDNAFELNVPAFTVAFGEVIGVVGTNGSGKTSFIESVLGFRNRLTGSVRLFGTDLSGSAKSAGSLRRIGVQLQTVCYSENFKVKELVDLHRMLYRTVDPSVAAALGMEELQKLSYGKLSRGQKQRVDLYIALAHQPELAFLDEPSTGLDHGFQTNLAELLAQRANNPRTATVMCSHDSDEVSICNRILWLKAGRIHQVIERGKNMLSLSALVACKVRLKIDPEHFDEVAQQLQHHAVLHHERMDSRTILAYGVEVLREFALELRAMPFVREVETYEADSSDFLRMVTFESGRTSALPNF